MPAKLYSTYRRRRYLKKGTKRSFARRVKTVARNVISPRRFHMMLPDSMRLRLRATETVQVSYNTTGGYDSFYYPLYFPGMLKDNSAPVPKFAGGFLQIMAMYSKAFVRNVKCRTRSMAVNVGTNVNLNYYTMVSSETEAIIHGTFTLSSIFEEFSNSKNAKKHYVSNANGGHNYDQDFRSVDVVGYSGMPVSLESAITKTGQSLIAFTAPTSQTVLFYNFSTPSQNEARTLPCYVIVVQHLAGGTIAAEVSFEFTFDFDIEFFELNRLPQEELRCQLPVWTRRV